MTAGHRRALAICGVVAIALAIGPTAALGRDGQVRLALSPVDQPGRYFDVTMGPGERRTFAVELADPSAVALPARTYAADVYTIVNGGFGGRLRGEPKTAMSTWLDYPDEVVALQPGQPVRRSFDVTVPDAAAPGEYITSIVLEDDAPIQGEGSLVLDQVVRQALAVVVTVPGPRAPELSIGAATQREVAGMSVVSVAVANPGNVRLKPAVEFGLFDATGARVSQATFQMDTFYAWTATFIEVPLAARLLPGAYTVRLSLHDDATGARAGADAIPLIVEAATSADAAVGTGAQLTPVDRGSAAGGGDLVLGWIALATGALLVLALGATTMLVRSRRHGRATRS
jgi:hypothetical protein